MQYKLIYEYPGIELVDEFFLSCLFFVVIALLIILLRKKIKFLSSRKITLIGVGFGILPTVCCLIILSGRISENSKIESMLADRNYLVVEGEIEKFDPATNKGKRKESFEIDGVYFEYSDYNNISGYHQTTQKNGIIKPNTFYRIAYYVANGINYIIKIEERID